MKYLAFITLLIITSNIYAQEDNSQKNDSIDCDKWLTKEVDEFSGEISFTAEVTDEVRFIKIKKGSTTRCYLSIRIKETGIYIGRGVTIILQNGKRINKPNEKVECNYIAGGFYSSAFIALTVADITLLKQSGILKYKLYISTGELFNYFAKWSKDLFNCLMKAK